LKLQIFALFLLIIPGLSGVAFGHTVDSVGEYRVEIGWMNEPIVSGETTAIEFYVSPLEVGLELEDQIFKNGITGLQKTIKIHLIFKDASIILNLSPDHDIPGKYHAFVTPTISGYYQANILGTIVDTPISLSMHPPKVDERSYIEFPEPIDFVLNQTIDANTIIHEDIDNLKISISNLEKSKQINVGYAGIVIGIAGVIIAVTALVKSQKK
jgi:hypothetical protein